MLHSSGAVPVQVATWGPLVFANLDLKDRTFLVDGLAHAGATLALLSLVIAGSSALRLRIHRYRPLTRSWSD